MWRYLFPMAAQQADPVSGAEGKFPLFLRQETPSKWTMYSLSFVDGTILNSWMYRSIKTPFQWLHQCDNSLNRRDEFQLLSAWDKDISELPSSRGVTSSCCDSWLTDKKEITHFSSRSTDPKTGCNTFLQVLSPPNH